ncbi:hypothetical protein M885DRAFT_549043 [Pelagophyceae sp. CCMP2097]|nr:hypothetical protein M885DRAFT_549043 [Pelagophyceae sp. CCMP2097]
MMLSMLALAVCADALQVPLSRRGALLTGAATAAGLAAPSPSQALEREFSNSNVLFKEDFWYKFGLKPGPLDPLNPALPGVPPFVRVQTRYDAYAKYSSKVNQGLNDFLAVFPAIQSGDKAALKTAADATMRSLRPMGLLANNLLATDTVPNEVLLARYYVNEAYLSLIDISDVADKADATKKFDSARNSMNSYLLVVNRVIIPKVGTPFALIS